MSDAVSMLTLHAVRHGESVCSATGCLCGGTCDTALTKTGQAAAAAIARRFSGPGRVCDAIISSPQRRALDTARPLALACSCPFAIDARLREVDYGSWDGKLPADITFSELAEFRAGKNAAPGGESLTAVAQRVAAALAAVQSAHPSGVVFLFSHKTTLRLLLCILLGRPPADYRDIPWPPAAIATLESRGDRMVVASGPERR